MNKIKIRNANLNDINDIVQLIIDSWNETYRGIISQAYLDDMKKNKTKLIKIMANEFNQKKIFVAIYNNEIIGFSELAFSNEFSLDLDIDCELCRLYVKNNYKKLGIGTKLYEYVISLFRKDNKKKMGVWCVKDNISAIVFYTKKGGKIDKETDFTLSDSNKIYKMVALSFDL